MTTNKLFALGSSVVVIVALLAGIILIGSPMDERLRRLDQQRINDLRMLSNIISQSYRVEGRLPDDLAELVNGLQLSQIPTDPETQAQYGYELTANDSFRLCAQFSAPSQQDEFWSHTAGQHCFSLTAGSRR